MISETRFARSYSSLWRELTPTLELLVRKVNLRMVDRQWTPMISKITPGRRALINQAAFSALKLSFALSSQHSVRSAWLDEDSNILKSELELNGAQSFNTQDIIETKTLAHRMLLNLTRHRPEIVELEPLFSGCGVINECSGDSLSQDLRFIELKDGDRPFRSYDFRQLVIYAALHMNDGKGIAKEIQIINSRRGVSVTLSFESFASEAAAQSPGDLLAEVVRIISNVNVYQN